MIIWGHAGLSWILAAMVWQIRTTSPVERVQIAAYERMGT